MLKMQRAIAGRKVVVWMHFGPHLDEVLAYYLVERYATPVWLDKYAPMGILRIGVGGGDFDEHACNGEPRKRNECAATLVATALEVDNLFSLQTLLRYVAFCDTGKPRHDKNQRPEEYGHPFGLHRLIDLRNGQFRRNPEAYDNDLIKVFERNLEDVRLFHQQQEEFAEAWELLGQAKRFSISGKGAGILVVMITSDNREVSRAARAQYQADLIVQREAGAGHVHIFSRNQAKLQLGDLVQMLNIMEQEKTGEVHLTDWRTLREEGSIEDGRWYYLPDTGQVHNSTESHPDTPPTQLSDEELERCVRVAMDPNYFDEERGEHCRQGTCVSEGVGDCPLHQFGLHRCRKIRYHQRSNQ